MKTGLLFGSFNPVHFGHLLLATRLREAAALNEIWFVVSPHNPHKNISGLADENHRLEMVRLALKGHNFLKCCDIEFSLPKPSYTHQTLKQLQQHFRDHIFSVIIGADNLEKFHTWKEAGWIQQHFEMLVYQRNKGAAIFDPVFKIFELPLIDVSATEIRKRVQEKKSIRYYVPEDVEAYIQINGLFI